ncbi:MAG: CehA/McbA family metallohydrolase [Chloroflexi bacterium]|nr:CehA/McbA family metallohydrolase [Chloroflexota bacterium]
MAFSIGNPYRQDASWRWYRGELHAHSLHSDGQYMPNQLRDIYQSHGYDFLALTDHDMAGDQKPLSADRDEQPYVLDPGLTTDSFLTIPSYEHSIHQNGVQLAHINCINATPGPAGIHRPVLDFQGAIDKVNAAGGFAFFCHPNVYPASPDLLRQCRNLTGVEIMNTGSVQYRTTFADPIGWGEATTLWDELLTRGDRLWGYANSDFHFFREEQPCRASNYVCAPALTRQAIVQQLMAGNCYASTGITFEEIAVRGAAISLRAERAETIRFVGRGGKVLHEERGPSASYEVQGFEGYVRAVCWNREPVLTIGRRLPSFTEHAWTQPFFVAENPGNA